nr:AMP-binding protein [uncultured Roseateles sp.]
MTRHWTRTYGEIPREIDPYRYPSIVASMDEALTRYSQRIAFRTPADSVTYQEVDSRSRGFAAFLQGALRVGRGDRVAVMMPNLLAFPIALLGIARAGAIQVNVNPLYTARELSHQLRDSQADVIVVFAGSLPTLAEIVHETAIRSVIVVGSGAGATTPRQEQPSSLPGMQTFEAAIEQGASLVLEPVQIDREDLLFLQYTGGTTGLSKGASLSHRNLVANIEQYKAFMPNALDEQGEVVVTAIPLYHIFALKLALAYLSVGAENWLVANPRDMDGFVEILRGARPTVFMGVNTLYGGLVLHPKAQSVDWSRLKLAIGGGSAVLKTTSDRWKALTGRFIHEGYGLSETSPTVSLNPQFVAEFNGTTGLPLPSTDVKLLDDRGLAVAIGTPGEICIKGPQVMRGYWNQPEANAAAFTDEGYFKTGDVGVFDDAGFLRIVDRKKDMIIVSGFNVYPNEIEAVAAAFAGVAESACVGVPDERTGEVVRLFVTAVPGASIDETALVEHCRANLTAYKVPKSVRVVGSLPKSNVGKILRRELRGID